MRKSIESLGLLIAAGLVLTGCGGSATSGGTATGSTSSATPTPTPTSKTYTNDQLFSIITTLKDAKGQAFTVIPAAQMDEGIIKARQLLQSAVITPAACNVLANSGNNVPEGSTYAGGTSLAVADKTTILMTIVAVKDTQIMATQLAKSNDALTQCATFTIEVAGQKIANQLQAVPATTSGDKSLGALITQTAPDGTKQSSITVSGTKGNLAATAVKSGPTVSSADSAELVQLVNEVLAKG